MQRNRQSARAGESYSLDAERHEEGCQDLSVPCGTLSVRQPAAIRQDDVKILLEGCERARVQLLLHLASGTLRLPTMHVVSTLVAR